MSYPQSGGYGYGQNPQGAQQYGQPADYGQQYGGQQYGGQQYGAQYGQQGYDAQAQYGQQYQQQAQYGYGAPQQPANPGLPANTPTIIAAVIGALGIITLFCGFLDGYSAQMDGGEGVQLFQSHFVLPYALVALAGLLALTTFLVGSTKHFVAVVTSVAVAAAIITIFQFSMIDPLFKEGGERGAGAIVLLITSILSAIAAIAWLLVEGGQIKLAAAGATQAATVDASQYAAQQQAAAAPGADYGYGYGQQYQQQAQAAQAQGAQAQAAQPQAGQAQAGQAQAGQAQPGQYAQTQYGQSAHAQQPGDSSATTAFVKPATDPGANPQSEQH
ncbi:DUF5336 domain-containing protein [Gordonia sp. HY002]|uniref:DUF5336 domain-containing protein n=1 Tax=Gordonia zhenghanii TaxID=2911516 RepID=UPI001EEFC03C|nr:DUF5336 domain-containing protein [Gordonia zhenghanii]MCF8570254.1 DUF5336 domain-containing protein [Gordonia zhenghanii]MCF8606833.1 DUF5336 domain-containing protein [Gordonia zhenghanii]